MLTYNCSSHLFLPSKIDRKKYDKDRFINHISQKPNQMLNLTLLENSPFQQQSTQQNNTIYSQLLNSHFYGTKNPQTHDITSSLNTTSCNNNGYTPSQMNRRVNHEPIKILAAPHIGDDFYTHLLDWSSRDIVSLGLQDSVYLWSPSIDVSKLFCVLPNNQFISSVSWHESGTILAIGNKSGDIHLYDACKKTLIRTYKGHQSRVGSLDWNGNILASGSKDRSILIRDIRTSADYFTSFLGHTQEICGIKWSPNKNFLASGGNDNKVILWNLKDQKEITRFTEHKAAVKALAWNPRKPNILATGGGTHDKSIKFWNCDNLSQMESIETGSQVCNLMFSKSVEELISTHGYSENEISLWKSTNQGLQKFSSLKGHKTRVLHMAMSPCGKYVLSGSSDETLRLWKLFPSISSEVIFENTNLFPKIKDLR